MIPVMPGTISSSITSYQAVLYGEDGASAVGGYIHCFHDGRNVVTCVFHDEANVPRNCRDDDGRVELHYPMSKFSFVLDLLRNEDELFFVFIESSGSGYIATNKEPVGDGELHR